MVEKQRYSGGYCLTCACDCKGHAWCNCALRDGVTDTRGRGKVSTVIPADSNRNTRVARSTRLLPCNNLGGDGAREGWVNGACGGEWDGSRRAGLPINDIDGGDWCRSLTRYADRDGE